MGWLWKHFHFVLAALLSVPVLVLIERWLGIIEKVSGMYKGFFPPKPKLVFLKSITHVFPTDLDLRVLAVIFRNNGDAEMLNAKATLDFKEMASHKQLSVTGVIMGGTGRSTKVDALGEIAVAITGYNSKRSGFFVPELDWGTAPADISTALLSSSNQPSIGLCLLDAGSWNVTIAIHGEGYRTTWHCKIILQDGQDPKFCT